MRPRYFIPFNPRSATLKASPDGSGGPSHVIEDEEVRRRRLATGPSVGAQLLELTPPRLYGVEVQYRF